ncbi:GH32 C-terminal domain-containing protein [Candidatus Poribacteria bacterium]
MYRILIATDGEPNKPVLKEGDNLLKDITGDLFHIRAEFNVGEAVAFGLKVRGVAIEYDTREEQLTCGDSHADLKPDDGKICLQVLVDRISIEIFANYGDIYMPMGAVLPDDEGVLATFNQGGSIQISQLAVHELKPAWQ